jgi:4-hydroxybenzoate polyprenyltransferase
MLLKTKQLFITSRPISWVNTAYPFAAGYFMTTRTVDATLVLGTLFFLVPYSLLMYGVNDVFDYESDILNPRKGGVEGAKLPKSTHGLVLLSAFSLSIPFVVFLLAHSRGVGSLVLLVVLLDVLAYSLPRLRFKERPFVDSVSSSIHFVGPLAFAFTFSPAQATHLVILLSFFLWGMASHAFGAVQDITADKQAGIGSIATVIGAKQTIRFAIGLYAAAGVIMLYFGWIGAIVGAMSLYYIASIWSYRNVSETDAPHTNTAWKRFIKLNWLTGFFVTMVLLYMYLHSSTP